MEVGVVVPVGPGRLENLTQVLRCLGAQTAKPRLVVLCCDGEDAWVEPDGVFDIPLAVLHLPKHEPGMEQPRNVGARLLRDIGERDPRFKGIDHVWFLDSDILTNEDCLVKFNEAHGLVDEDRILVGPYDWLPPGVREPMPELRNDPQGVPPPGRWASFNEHPPDEVLRSDLSAGLACFSGNLIWPLEQFHEVGGFWNELHHGRCEDGELGLRAVAHNIGISFVGEARGWHLDHPRDYSVIEARNARDVPMLNERHPWVQQQGLMVVDEDGKRFDVKCPDCGQQMNSALIFAHRVECQKS